MSDLEKIQKLFKELDVATYVKDLREDHTPLGISRHAKKFLIISVHQSLMFVFDCNDRFLGFYNMITFDFIERA